MGNDNTLIKYLNEMINKNNFKMFIKLLNFYNNSKQELNIKGDFNIFLMEQTHEESKNFLRKFVSLLNSFCPDFEFMRYNINSINKLLKNSYTFEDLDKFSTSKSDTETLKKCEPILSEFKTFCYMMSKFIISNYLVYDGKQLDINVPQLDLSAPLKKWEETSEKVKLRNYDCIISKSGEIYLAIWEHELLCYWLSMNNISLDNALRVCQDPTGNRTLSMSSLAPYRYHENTEKDKTMYLTDEQARSLFEMFMKLSKGKRTYNGQTLEDLFCDASENLGAGRFDDRKNLKYNALTLEEVSGEEMFYAKNCINKIRARAQEEHISEEEYKQKLADTMAQQLTEMLKNI